MPKSMIDRVLALEHHVRRLEIAMDDPGLVSGLQSRRHLDARGTITLRNRQTPVAGPRFARSWPSMHGIVMSLIPWIPPRS